ncbi:MAG: MFS transporter [Coxiellaceae bacterium]|nr:MFS transporter [Coxiellaceae bacterium]
MLISIKKITMIVVAITLFMDVMDSNILNTAAPVMAASFHVNPVDLKVAMISYLLSFAIFIPTSGWFSDKFGTKRIFIGALTLFTLSSFFCGFATTLPEIVFARFIQGIGGAFMISLGRLMIARVFQRNELVEAMNAVIMVVSIGVMIGPYIGGVIVDNWSWSWIFWVNLPVGIVLITLSALFLKDTAEKNSTPFDFIGFILFGGGLALLCFSLSEVSESNGNTKAALLKLLIAITTLLLYVIYALRKRHPLIQLPLFKIRTFSISVFGNLLARLGFGGIPFLLPLMQQTSFGFSAQLSGLLLMPISFGIIFAKIITLKLLRKMGYRNYLIGNTLCVGIILYAFQLITRDSSLLFISIMTFVFGTFIAMQYTAMNSLAFSDITDEKLSASTSITSTVQILGQTLGVATGAIFLRLFSTNLSLTPAAFHKTFVGLSVLTFLSVIIFMQLKSDDGLAMIIKNKN